MRTPLASAAWGLFLTALLAGAAAGQETRTPEAMQKARALKAELDRIEAALPPERRVGPGPLAEAKLGLRKLAILLEDNQGWWAPGPEQVEAALAQVRRGLAGLKNPAAPVPPATGLQERAYISRIDGSPEPYVIYVPTNYTPDRAWPLLVFLHGYHPYLTVTNWLDYMYCPAWQEVCEREGVLFMLPYGRSNTEFMGIGESDVLNALRYTRAEFRVDPQRIILSGASMGGSGAYSIACHYPDLFAAVMAIAGRADYYAWMGAPKESLPRFKQAQVDTDYAYELVGNLRHVPVTVFHGGQDTLVPRSQSRTMVDLLRRLGQRVEYVEHAGAGHNDTWTPTALHPTFAETLRAARAPVAPAEVVYRTFTTKYPGAYWARIEEIAAWGQAADIRAVAKTGRIDVECRNVAAFVLGPGMPQATIPPGGRPTVSVNGRETAFETAEGGVLRVRLQPAPDGPLRKTPQLCGPIREAWDAPFLIVFPSEDTPETTPDRDTARRLMVEWRQFAQWYAPALPDTRVTEAHIAERNLILCGSPATNRVLARIADQLPLRIEKDRYVLGKRAFPTAGNGMMMIYPNPLNPARYVVVAHGAAWGPRLEPNHKLDLLPDFILYRAQTPGRVDSFTTNDVLCAGYFDSAWRLAEGSTELLSNADEARAAE